MNTFELWKRRIEENRDILFDVMRIYLGFGLFVKGVQFSQDTTYITEVVRQAGASKFLFDAIDLFGAHYIVLAHIGGGLLLAAGLMTRISTCFQFPILAGAVFLAIRSEQGIFSHNLDFDFTALVLALLILIFLHGGGRLSVDHYLKSD
jgi:putative oxidoreductase